MGALADALGSLQVAGHLLLGEAYAPPWGIAVPSATQLVQLLGLDRRVRPVPFHLVRRGGFELRRPGEPVRVVNAGEAALLPCGDAHRLSEGRSPPVTPLAEVLSGRRPRSERPTSTALICGVFLLRDVGLNPLFTALPPVIVAPVDGPRASHLARGAAGLLAAEVDAPGARRPWVVGRLVELLCAELVAGTPPQGGSWLRAVRDRSIGAALDAFHRDPGAAWTVPGLARRAALSPSRFAARFRELLGESPMAYVTSWRVAAAARHLRDTGDRVEDVARAFGYTSLPAFSRAFKRRWGCPPSEVKRAG